MVASQFVDRPPLPDRLVRSAPTSRHRMIAAAQVDGWCADFARTGDARLRERIADAHEWLVWLLAKRMRRRDEPLEDLVQVARIGLLSAIDRFDPTFGVSFHTYASSTILGELRRHYRSTWRIRVPRRLQERYLAVHHATEQLTGQLQRTPTEAELGALLGIEAHEVAEAMTIGASSWMAELNEADATVDDQAAARDDRMLVEQLLGRLAPTDRTILVSWLVDGASQQEVGKRFGLTQVQVSRSARRSLRTLRALVADDAA